MEQMPIPSPDQWRKNTWGNNNKQQCLWRFHNGI